jgi:tetratricopeptide (TPR) repeat protein
MNKRSIRRFRFSGRWPRREPDANYTGRSVIMKKRIFVVLLLVAAMALQAQTPDQEIAQYTEAIRRNPNDVEAYFYRGNAYLHKKGNLDKAIADYSQAIRLKPDLADAYSNRGDAYYEKGDYDKAIADCTQAIRLNSDDALAYYHRGRAYG